MPVRDFPFDAKELANRFGTPLWVYHREVLQERLRELLAFDVVRFAQKSNSNLAVLKTLQRAGAVVDSVSAGEIHRALLAGFLPKGEPSGIIYTADLFDRDALALIREHKVPVCVGSPDMITQLADENIDVPVILRVNPGFGHGHSQKVNTGGELSKHGIWYEQVSECMELGRRKGIALTGLHMHIGSGSDLNHLGEVATAMEIAAEAFGPALQSVSAGGGIPVPYHFGEERIDLDRYHKIWDEARRRMEQKLGSKIALEVEPGRYLSAEAGFLLSEVRSVKETGNTNFILADAGFTDLVRPAFYGAYHEISIVSNQPSENSKTEVVVAGPLCESCDVFTQEDGGVVVPRTLPKAKVGDIVVLHDAGAYGAVMSSNYNSRLLAAEVMISKGEAHLIRKRQTFEELVARDCIPDFLR